MSTPPYRAVLIGLTGIGANRPQDATDMTVYDGMPRSHAAAYHAHAQTELVGVCDLRQEVLDEFKQTWQDVWPDVAQYTDYHAMLQELKPDIVSVATSDHVHADMTVAAATSGARIILCEKPIATSLADTDRMIAAAEANNVLLSIDHTRRWDTSHLKARQLIRSGDLGPLRTISVEQYSQRAMLFRNGTHLIDLINFFADAEPQWVVAELEEGFEHFTEYQGGGGRDPSTDPYASAYIRYSKGIRAFYNSYKVNFAGSQTILTCEEGRIEISDRQAQVIRSQDHFTWSSSELHTSEFRSTHQLGYLCEAIDVLENGGELISPGREARKTVEIMLGILDSHHRGNVRVDFPLT